jgi:hypothetical protein
MATTETRRYRGYDIVPMRQGSQWSVGIYPTRADLPTLARSTLSNLAAQKKDAVAEAKQKIDRILARLDYPYASLRSRLMSMTNPSLNTMATAETIDIVERLRVRPLLANDDPDIAEWRESMDKAADEIEKLRDENTFLKKGNVGVCEAIDDASEQEMTLEEITAEIQQLLNDKNVFGLPND